MQICDHPVSLPKLTICAFPVTYRLTASKERIRINTDFLLKLVSDDVDWPDNENRVHGKRHRRINGRH